MLAAKAELVRLVLIRADPQTSILPQQAMKAVDNSYLYLLQIFRLIFYTKHSAEAAAMAFEQ